MKILYFDTETTGFDSVNNRMIEIAIFSVDNGRIIDEYDRFINIHQKLPEKIVELTSITDEILEKEGLEENVVAKEVKERVSEGCVMVAHNCQFDLGFIYNLLIRHYNKEEIDNLFKSITWVDSLTILKDRKSYPHKLSDGIDYYNIKGVQNSHRAIDDTKALFYLMQAMALERNDITKYFNIFGVNPKYGINGTEFPFITYKKQPYTDGLQSESNILPLR